MASAVGGMKNVKIFVLYLMQNLGRALDFITLNDIVMQTDYIMYLDFAEAFGQMLDGDLIREAGKLTAIKCTRSPKRAYAWRKIYPATCFPPFLTKALRRHCAILILKNAVSKQNAPPPNRMRALLRSTASLSSVARSSFLIRLR
ncbi:MAG: DUF4364 family protein [Clostridia bacterium]|nr:DUF4364 family protein [Clostridia bacterium]